MGFARPDPLSADTPVAGTPERPPLGLGAPAVVALQRTAGNQAVGRAIGRSAAFGQATSGPPSQVPRRSAMEAAFGTSFGDVRAYLGGPAAEAGLGALGAHAAARGTDVVFRDASPPDELLAHELAHVVQQRRGVQGVACDTGPSSRAEHAAQAAGAAVAAGRPVGDVGAAAPGDIQLSTATTAGGVWTTTRYEPINQGSKIGGSIRVEFMPQDPVVATQIGLVQTVKTDETIKGENRPGGAIDPGYAGVLLPEGSVDPGRQIDQRPTPTTLIAVTSPFLRATATPDRNSKQLGDELLDHDKGDHGKRVALPDGQFDVKASWIDDNASRAYDKDVGQRYRQTFEVTALAIDGPLAGQYLGSIEWGWRSDADGKSTLDPPEIRVLRGATPSAEFMAAARQWNDATLKDSSGEHATVDLPLDDSDPRALPIGQLVTKLAEARAKRGAGPREELEAKELEVELMHRQVCVTVDVKTPDDGPDATDDVLVVLNAGKRHECPMAPVGAGGSQRFFAALAEFAPKVPLENDVRIQVFDFDKATFDDRAIDMCWKPGQQGEASGRTAGGGEYHVTVDFVH